MIWKKRGKICTLITSTSKHVCVLLTRLLFSAKLFKFVINIVLKDTHVVSRDSLLRNLPAQVFNDPMKT